MLDAVRARAQKAIHEQIFPGCVIGILHGADIQYVCVGGPTYDTQDKVTEQSLYDVASITKSVPTASLASILISQKKLSLDDLVKTHVPELQNDHGATVRDILMYAVTGAQMSTLKNLSADKLYQHVFESGFAGAPGERNYSNLPAFVLGLVLERAIGRSLDILAQEYFFTPLGMRDSAFYIGAPFSHAVPTEQEDWRGLVQGCTHDESAYVLGRAGRASGHAGLFSTAQDLLVFARALLQPTDHAWETIVSHAEAGLGWQTKDSMNMGSHIGPGAFGKTGFTGTSIVIDRSAQTAFVILSNRTFPRRPPDTRDINAFRGDIADIIFRENRS